MRNSLASVKIARSLGPASWAFAAVLLVRSSACSQEICPMLRSAWDNVRSYECKYRAVTQHEGKHTESVMRYRFQRPNMIRMDIESPKKGAVLIYNPSVSEKVRVRPFPSLKSLVLKYPLAHKRVSTDSGGTVDKSHLGGRVEEACKNLAQSPESVLHLERNPREITEKFSENGKNYTRRYVLTPDNLISKIETLNEKGNVESMLEWTDVKINVDFDPKTFEEF